MSDRPVDISVASGASASGLITDEERAASRSERKARIAQVLDRGVVGDRLYVELPADTVGQWVPKDKAEIARMESLGYRLDSEFATKRRLHDGGDGLSYVGDVVHMIADKETRDIIDEIKRERYDKMNDPSRQKEERDFKASTNTLSDVGIKGTVESSTNVVKRDDIAAALKPNLKI